MLLNMIKRNLKLSLPILLTRLLGMSSNVIAMILIAKLGTDALSAGALIMGVFSICVLLVMSFSFALCGLIAESCARQQLSNVGAIIRSSIILNSLLSIPFLFVFYYMQDILLALGQPSAVANLAGNYFQGIIFGYLPMLWVNIIEQFFIGINKPRYIVYLSIFSLFSVPLISYLFIFGYFGFPSLGMLGAGYAVSVASVINFLLIIGLIILKKWHRIYHWVDSPFNINFVLMKKLYRIGWPMALQFAGEFSAYVLITLIMGWVGVIALAAQQVTLQFSSMVTMIPMSISQATTVLVAEAKAKSDFRLLKYQVNVSLSIVCIAMVCIGILYLVFPEQLAHIYLMNNANDSFIVPVVKELLIILALSQLFDGIKNILSGAYRGMQETKLPMIITMTSLWLLSIPAAYSLGLLMHYGAFGVRLGFALGMAVAAILLSIRWYRTPQIKSAFISDDLAIQEISA